MIRTFVRHLAGLPSSPLQPSDTPSPRASRDAYFAELDPANLAPGALRHRDVLAGDPDLRLYMALAGRCERSD